MGSQPSPVNGLTWRPWLAPPPAWLATRGSRRKCCKVRVSASACRACARTPHPLRPRSCCAAGWMELCSCAIRAVAKWLCV
eukprot:4614744-Karenia_brevis.AAC.1